jgi:glycosyltransferase involved in cell wall biosynthesis
MAKNVLHRSALMQPKGNPHSSVVPRVALAHDYLNQNGGAERVVEQLHTLFPDAPVYASIYDRERMPDAYREWEIHSSFMQHLPGVMRHHQPYLPLYPLAMASFNLREYPLIVSSSSAFGKGVRVPTGALHVCYCHAPMRFAWNYEAYASREGFGRAVDLGIRPLLAALRRWDRATSDRVDHFIANSRTVAVRIARIYGRDATVIYPPVETERYAPPAGTPEEPEPFFFLVSRLVPYKRIDLAIQAANALGARLEIASTGRDRARLEAMAGPTVRFLGWVSDEEKREKYARCTATLFPAEDDFGIAQLEAMAAGRPVVAYGRGGSAESVRDGVTGILFGAQTVEAMMDAMRRVQTQSWDRATIIAHARRFDAAVFRARMADFLVDAWRRHSGQSAAGSRQRDIA